MEMIITEMTTHRKAAPRMRKGTISREVEGLVSIGVDVSTFAMILQRVATRRPRRGGGDLAAVGRDQATRRPAAVGGEERTARFHHGLRPEVSAL